MTKTSCWLRFGYPASLLQTNFPLPRGWKNGGFFEYEVYLLFTAGEVGGLTGVVFSIYKSTLILNIKLINNFCLHTHLFHKIRGKGLLELHFVSIMHLLTASYLDTIAEVFYYVNYVNVNYSVKNSTVDCKNFLWVSRYWPNSLDCTDLNQCGACRDAELCRLCYKRVSRCFF